MRSTVAGQKATGAFLQITSTAGGKLVSASSPVAGVVDVAIQIPNDPALIGVALRHQQLQAGLDAAGALVSLSSSNLLQSVVGDF
mgnify:CR=1 FL=1